MPKRKTPDLGTARFRDGDLYRTPGLKRLSESATALCRDRMRQCRHGRRDERRRARLRHLD